MQEEVEYYENYDLEHIVTPVDVAQLSKLLVETGYHPDKTRFLVEGFTHGFDLGYRGPENVCRRAPNLKFTVGSPVILWNKIMKEVKLKRYAGPFRKIPFKNFIQSPVGLVPKDGGKSTRLIFHLSYPRQPQSGLPESVNANTPKHLTSVKYKDFDEAVRLCSEAGKGCHAGKSDMSSAFRHLAILRKYWKYLVMMAVSPLDQQIYYFVDKCLPFGAAISCAVFQAFSDAVAHVVRVKSGHDLVNYLDDYFFAQLMSFLCNNQIRLFLEICDLIKFPVGNN